MLSRARDWGSGETSHSSCCCCLHDIEVCRSEHWGRMGARCKESIADGKLLLSGKAALWDTKACRAADMVMTLRYILATVGEGLWRSQDLELGGC
jgi:hypothetical protein